VLGIIIKDWLYSGLVDPTEEEAMHQPNPITMFISVRCSVGIKEWLYSGLVNPMEE